MKKIRLPWKYDSKILLFILIIFIIIFLIFLFFININIFLYVYVPLLSLLILIFLIFLLSFNNLFIGRKKGDFIGRNTMLLITVFFVTFFFILFSYILVKSLLILETHSITEILFSSNWNPEYNKFGLYPIIIVTIIVTGIALLIAVPISIFSALYITEYAPRKIRKTIRPFIDVLAGVPSVVYGLCAFLFLVPLVKDVIAPAFGIESTGSCVFTAAITLAVMVFPIIISLCIESFDAIPISLREASLSVGATKWETVKKVLFRASAPNLISAVLLGFGRAFGETIAVSMVVGGIPTIPQTIFGPGQTLASLIVSAYGEMMSVPLYESALMMVTLILFIVVVIFNLLGFIILRRTKRKWKI